MRKCEEAEEAMWNVPRLVRILYLSYTLQIYLYICLFIYLSIFPLSIIDMRGGRASMRVPEKGCLFWLEIKCRNDGGIVECFFTD